MSGTALTIAAIVFIAAGVLRWYGWTQVFVPQNFPAWAHRPSPITVVIALTAIGSLVGIALNVTKSTEPEHTGSGATPQLWLVGIAALAGGLAWSVLLFLAYGAAPGLPVGVPLVA
jgi:hypothetical protein